MYLWQMKILLVSATKFEITPLLKTVRKIRSGEDLSSYRMGKHAVDVLITGVGMTQTAFRLGKILSQKKYDIAINTGLAGSFRKGLQLGEVVNVTADCFADFGTEDGRKFLTAEEIKLVSAIQYRAPGKVTGELKKVKGITVNTVHGNTASIKKAVKKFNPDIETMEGAAFFLACTEEEIPCIQIRAISNYVVRRNKKKWETHRAITNLNNFIEKMILKF